MPSNVKTTSLSTSKIQRIKKTVKGVGNFDNLSADLITYWWLCPLFLTLSDPLTDLVVTLNDKQITVEANGKLTDR